MMISGPKGIMTSTRSNQVPGRFLYPPSHFLSPLPKCEFGLHWVHSVRKCIPPPRTHPPSANLAHDSSIHFSMHFSVDFNMCSVCISACISSMHF